MSDTSPRDQKALLFGAKKAAPRVARPGELLCESYVEKTKKFYRIELRDHGQYGVEAQILDPIDPLICRTFRQELDPTRTPRAMAIAWAEEERKDLERGIDR